MIQTRTLTDPMKRWATFALLVFSLNFAWEMMQMNWFASMQGPPLWRTTLVCARATLGDLVITAMAFGIAALVGKSTRWPTGPRVVIAAITFVVVGITITVVYEIFALAKGMWRYDETMPAVFGIGALPLLQWLLLPVVEVLLFRFMAQGKAGVGRKGGAPAAK